MGWHEWTAPSARPLPTVEEGPFLPDEDLNYLPSLGTLGCQVGEGGMRRTPAWWRVTLNGRSPVTQLPLHLTCHRPHTVPTVPRHSRRGLPTFQSPSLRKLRVLRAVHAASLRVAFGPAINHHPVNPTPGNSCPYLHGLSENQTSPAALFLPDLPSSIYPVAT